MNKLKITSFFGAIPNEILFSNKISLKAKGLFGYLQAKPDGWEFSSIRIAYECKESKNTINSILQELETVGLLERKKFNNPDTGTWNWSYILKNSPFTKYRGTENRDTDFWEINKEVDTNKEKQKKNINTAIGKIADVFFFIFDNYQNSFFKNYVYSREIISKQSICECFANKLGEQGVKHNNYPLAYEDIEKACLNASYLNDIGFEDIDYSKRQIKLIHRIGIENILDVSKTYDYFNLDDISERYFKENAF